MSREDAYAAVQRSAMQAWSAGGDFRALLGSDPAVAAKLKPAELDQLFDLAYHLKHVDTIFDRVFGVDAVPPRPSGTAKKMGTSPKKIGGKAKKK
jgi:adenylosuccinate lyase